MKHISQKLEKRTIEKEIRSYTEIEAKEKEIERNRIERRAD